MSIGNIEADNLKAEIERDKEFAKWGFKAPDFECEIFKKQKDKEGIVYIGYVKTKENTIMGCVWEENGDCYMGTDANNPIKYNLTPLKVNWWEKEENIGNLIYVNNKFWKGLCIFKHLHENTITVRYIDSTEEGIYNVNDCRPATKEECLSLCIEEMK